MLSGRSDWLPWIVAAWSSLTLLAVGGIVLMRNPGTSKCNPAPRITSIHHDSNADEELVARLDALLKRRKLYLDPELTLGRLACALHVLVKQLSSTINRNTGGNVSRHVDSYRVREACRTLEAGASVTEAMLASNFNTKSNFNREFRRVTGGTPSAWRRMATGRTSHL